MCVGVVQHLQYIAATELFVQGIFLSNHYRSQGEVKQTVHKNCFVKEPNTNSAGE